MRGFVARSSGKVGSAVTRRSMVRKVLLVCGVISFPLYFTGHIVAGMQLEGYSHIDQMVSELNAVGAPTRPLVLAFGIVYEALVIAFGIGVWRAAHEKRPLRVAAIALVAFGVIGMLGWFAPMTPRGTEGSATDIAHIVYAIATVLSMVLFIGFGSG